MNKIKLKRKTLLKIRFHKIVENYRMKIEEFLKIENKKQKILRSALYVIRFLRIESLQLSIYLKLTWYKWNIITTS